MMTGTLVYPSISAAVEIAFLKEEEQKWFLEAMDYAQATPSLSQAQITLHIKYNPPYKSQYLSIHIFKISMISRFIFSDLIPGNIELSGLEVLLANVMSRENILKEYIDQIKDQYGYIIYVLNTPIVDS